MLVFLKTVAIVISVNSFNLSVAKVFFLSLVVMMQLS